MSKTPVLQPLEKTDYSGLGRLFSKIFGTERSLDAWIWKYDKNPHGSPIATVAAVGEDIVGFYGLLTRRVNFRGEILTAFQEVDLMVDPDHAAGGLFRNLGRQCYDQLVEQGHPFTFGFPNQTSLPLGKRILGWRAIERIPLWTMILDPESILADRLPRVPGLRTLAGRAVRIRNRFRLQTTYRDSVRQTTVPGESVGGLFDQPVPASGIEFIRDRAYLQWRYCECPEPRYVFFEAGSPDVCEAAAVAGIAPTGRANLAEFRWREGCEAAATAVLQAVAEWAAGQGCSTLRAWALENSPDARFLASRGFFDRDALNFHVIRSFRIPEFNRYLWDARLWRLSSGDSDCV